MMGVTFEEYRYDAMGRRIWVRSRKACYGHAVHTMCNLSLVRRTVWDGDRELYEIQMPAWEDTPVSTIEDDFAAPEEEVHHPFYLEDRNPFFGRVAYTYGHGIDRPLSVVRMGYRDLAMTPYVEVQSPWRTHLQPFAILPLWDAHGNIDGAVLSVNGVVNGGRTKCEMWRSRLYCIKIDWAESFFAYDRPRYQRWHWHGTLLEDKRNETGTYYRRNRTYDPSTGRFTQEDPIGLAGGLNVYGFAAGDPVSYSDPYGLNPCRLPNLDAAECAKQATLAMLEGSVAFLGSFARATGIAGIGEAATGLDSNTGERLNAHARAGRGAVAAAAFIPVGRAGRGIQILEREGSHIIGAFVTSSGSARFMTELVRRGDDLILRGTHIEGTVPLRESLQMAREFGRSEGARRVIIEGGRRTTGANPGRRPRRIILETGL